jgi:N-sulfoglucosamine sulfohydrolase
VLFLSDNGIPFPVSKTNLYDPGINLPLIVSSPNQKRRGAATDALVSWVDVLPTILDWTGAKPAYPLPGRSFLPVLNPEHADAWDVVYGSQQLHEITMYYPMRMIRTRRHKYILNLASKLDFPMAQDLYGSLTWQGVLRRGSKFLGQRSIESYVRRPREELYDLKSDPHELKNVAGEPAYAPILSDLRARLRSWQEKTSDPWIIKYIHE